MSELSVSYSSLKNASGEATDVAKKLRKYKDAIDDTIYKKLNKYDGEWTDNIYNARSAANRKMTALESKAQKYDSFASSLNTLRERCDSVDISVKNRISSLTASFKEHNGIRNSKIENAVSYFFTSIGNSTRAGRWVRDKKDEFRTKTNELKQRIKAWYGYEGGKEFIKGALIAALEIAIGLLSVVIAVLSGGALIVMIAGIVGGVIAVVNGVVNLVNEGRALHEAGDDPALARRLSNEDSMQDVLRDGDITDEKNEGWLNNHVSTSRLIANGIDLVTFICTAIQVVDGAGKLLSKGYKWANGGTEGTFKEIFSKDGFSKIFSKIGESLKDFGRSFKTGSFTKFVTGLKDFGSDFLANLKSEYWKFGGATSLDTFKTIKNICSISKDFLKDGLGGEFGKFFCEDILYKGITVAHIDVPKGSYADNITVDDFYSIYDKISTKLVGSDLFKPEGIDINIDMSLLEKLSTSCDVNISIPDIQVPDISMPDIRTPGIHMSAAA